MLASGTASARVVAAMGNVGAGWIERTGPKGHYCSWPEAAKWILTFLMLFGRLDIMTVLVLITPTFWRG